MTEHPGLPAARAALLPPLPGGSVFGGTPAAAKKEPLLAKPGVYQYLSLSPDGKRVALTVTEGGSQDVWVYHQERDAMTRLTSGG